MRVMMMMRRMEELKDELNFVSWQLTLKSASCSRSRGQIFHQEKVFETT